MSLDDRDAEIRAFIAGCADEELPLVRRLTDEEDAARKNRTLAQAVATIRQMMKEHNLEGAIRKRPRRKRSKRGVLPVAERRAPQES